MFGTAAPYFGQPGGGFHIFVQQLSCMVLGRTCQLP
jgi:hypothetical protein